MTQDTWLIMAGLAGFIFHTLLKMRSLNEDAKAANLKFNPLRDYLLKDIFGVLTAFMAPFIWWILFGEVAAKYPALHNFARVSFFCMGAIGSYILQLFLGQAKKQIRNIVDAKTNISDQSINLDKGTIKDVQQALDKQQ